MNHEQFVKAYNERTISASIDKDKAGFFYENPYLLPNSVRRRQALLRTGMFGLIAIGIVLFFFVPWYIALAVTIAGLVFSRIAQADAAKGLFESLITSEGLYKQAIDQEALVIRELKK